MSLEDASLVYILATPPVQPPLPRPPEMSRLDIKGCLIMSNLGAVLVNHNVSNTPFDVSKLSLLLATMVQFSEGNRSSTMTLYNCNLVTTSNAKLSVVLITDAETPSGPCSLLSGQILRSFQDVFRGSLQSILKKMEDAMNAQSEQYTLTHALKGNQNNARTEPEFLAFRNDFVAPLLGHVLYLPNMRLFPEESFVQEDRMVAQKLLINIESQVILMKEICSTQLSQLFDSSYVWSIVRKFLSILRKTTALDESYPFLFHVQMKPPNAPDDPMYFAVRSTRLGPICALIYYSVQKESQRRGSTAKKEPPVVIQEFEDTQSDISSFAKSVESFHEDATLVPGSVSSSSSVFNDDWDHQYMDVFSIGRLLLKIPPDVLDDITQLARQHYLDKDPLIAGQPVARTASMGKAPCTRRQYPLSKRSTGRRNDSGRSSGRSMDSSSEGEESDTSARAHSPTKVAESSDPSPAEINT